MKCPYCNNEFLSRHVPFCNKRDLSKNREELRAYFLEFNIPDLFEYKNLYKIYIVKKMSLPEIKNKFNIDYKNIQFMLKFYKIPIRGHSSGAKNSMDKREKTNIERYGAKNVLCKGTEKYNKKNKTVKEKYGVDNVFQIPEIIERINSDEECIKKNGCTRKELISKNAKFFWSSLTKEERSDIFKNFYSKEAFLKIRNSKIKNRTIIPDHELDEWSLYKRNCRRMTKTNLKELYDNWDGYDFYDGEYIKDNLSLDYRDKKYPTVDHRVSIFYGFTNGIPVEVISSIDNLCITKRSVNSSKGHKLLYD